MKNLKVKEMKEMNHSELININGGDSLIKKSLEELGRLYGKLCSWASFEDSNSINEGYVGRGR